MNSDTSGIAPNDKNPLSQSAGFDSVVISIPPKVGPNKSLYRYSNLREAYARKFIELSMEEEELTERIEHSGAAVPSHLSNFKNRSNFTSRGAKSLAPENLKTSAFLNYLTSGKEQQVEQEIDPNSQEYQIARMTLEDL